MRIRLITAKVTQSTLDALRLIAELTGELQYRAAERIMLAELKRLQKKQPKGKKP